MTTPTLGVVQAPPLAPPTVGLIASLGPVGGPYLDPPDSFDGFDLPPYNPDTPWPAPPAAMLVPAGGDRGDPGPPQRAAAGVTYLPEGKCTTEEPQDPCSPSYTPSATTAATVEAASFNVWDGDVCSTFGFAAHDYIGRAVRRLLAVESFQIAREFWTGDLAAAKGWPNRYLANNGFADVLSNGAVTAAQALDCLEQAVAACGMGQRAAIHVTPQLGSALSNLGNTVQTVNNVVRTYRGSIIIADAGYDGSGPNGQPATSGSQWAYATLMPTVRRGPITVTPTTFAEAIDKRTNRLEWRAERWANISVGPCCHFAIQVDLPLCLVGGAS